MSSACARASSISCLRFLVERSFFRVLTMCPFAVAVEGERNLLMSSLVTPGNVISSLECLVNTRSMEEGGGDPNDWWWYFASSSLLVVLRVVTMLFASCGWVGTCWGVGGACF